MSGIERDIDALGRVVIPVEFRKLLGMTPNSTVSITVLDGEIIIKTKNEVCALCGEKLDGSKGVRLCSRCIEKVKQQEP